MKLKGKIALVTGGTSGIGKATAQLFSDQGAQVILTGRTKETVEQTVAEIGMANSSVYSAAKAAVQSFTKTFAAELISKNIRVNAVSPGPIETNYFDRSNLSEEQVQQFTTSFAPQVPIKRFGQALEVAQAVLFLASDDSSFIVGTEISVDGGFPKIKAN